MPGRDGAKPGTQPEPPCARPCLPMSEALKIPWALQQDNERFLKECGIV